MIESLTFSLRITLSLTALATSAVADDTPIPARPLLSLNDVSSKPVLTKFEIKPMDLDLYVYISVSFSLSLSLFPVVIVIIVVQQKSRI